ncbi:MAG: DUF2634 domain-containing protein [Alkaliphilus sp.]|nr:DUF2634 domain-containing protein [bacterium AH-315-E09]PHS34893.1 MAG: DUF2634 domain-containing protein [Alkaliphilus sp.]
MVGFYNTDVRIDSEMQIAKAANGDAALVTGFECLQQDIRHEALTQEKEVFYDEEYGWSLLDFVQAEDDNLVRIELKQRIVEKLGKRLEVDAESIKVTMSNEEDRFLIRVKFKCDGYEKEQELNIVLDRLNVEVVIVR